MWTPNIDWRKFGSLSHPEEDDSYLFEADECSRKNLYNPAEEWDEEEAVEACFCEN